MMSDPQAKVIEESFINSGPSLRFSLPGPKPKSPSSARILKKPVDALAIVPTNRRLTAVSRKVINVFLYLAQQQGMDVLTYQAPLGEVMRLAGWSSNNYEAFKEAIRDLMRTSVEWQSPTTGEGSAWGMSGVVADVEIISRGGVLFVEWSYGPKLKQQLLEPSRYARLSLLYLAALRTVSAIVLYEICVRYVDNPSKVTARQAWRWWKPVLIGDRDSGGDKYDEYKYFKRDILKPAIAEVSAITDLDIELIEHKKGRFVDALQFSVNRKQAERLHRDQFDSGDLKLVGQAMQLGLPQEKAQSLLTRHGRSEFEDGIKKLNSRQANTKQRTVENPASFLSAMLENSPRKESVRGAETKESAPKLSRSLLLEQFRNLKREELLSLFLDMDEAERTEIFKNFSSGPLASAHILVQRGFEKMGLKNAMARAIFLGWYGKQVWGENWESPSDAELLSAFSHP